MSEQTSGKRQLKLQIRTLETKATPNNVPNQNSETCTQPGFDTACNLHECPAAAASKVAAVAYF